MRIFFAFRGFFIYWSAVTVAAAASQDGRECVTAPQNENGVVQKILCVDGRVFESYYSAKAARIEVKSTSGKIFFRIPSGYEPTLVGSDSLIGFLPDKLQVYKKNNVLAFVSTIRTNGGDGMGQCGSGSEIYLNFLDVSRKVPKLSARILIGSCKESIELGDQDVSRGKIGDINVVDNKLTLHFLNYREIDGEPEAVVTPDFKLQFRGTKEE